MFFEKKRRVEREGGRARRPYSNHKQRIFEKVPLPSDNLLSPPHWVFQFPENRKNGKTGKGEDRKNGKGEDRKNGKRGDGKMGKRKKEKGKRKRRAKDF